MRGGWRAGDVSWGLGTSQFPSAQPLIAPPNLCPLPRLLPPSWPTPPPGSAAHPPPLPRPAVPSPGGGEWEKPPSQRPSSPVGTMGRQMVGRGCDGPRNRGTLREGLWGRPGGNGNPGERKDSRPPAQAVVPSPRGPPGPRCPPPASFSARIPQRRDSPHATPSQPCPPSLLCSPLLRNADLRVPQ